MALSSLFNATGPAKERLDLLQQALETLQEQRKTQSRHADVIWQQSYALANWQVLVARAETADGGRPLRADSVGSTAVEEKRADIAKEWSQAVKEIGAGEYKLVETLSKIFTGADAGAKLAAFFADATALQTPGATALKSHARETYKDNPPGSPLNRDLAVTDIAVKTGNRKLINRQIRKIEALIDDGHLGNKAKRLAWQTARKFGVA